MTSTKIQNQNNLKKLCTQVVDYRTITIRKTLHIE